jgi:hypothetical protein
MANPFSRGERIVHARRGPGVFVESAGRDTSVVALDDSRVDGRVLTDPMSLDDVVEVTTDLLRPERPFDAQPAREHR